MNTHIHRLLDEAFAAIDMTPEIQDLKEEIRGNLIARVAELEEAGARPAEAAHRAVAELGDVRELVAPEAGAPVPAGYDFARHRVRPQPGFVVRVTAWAIIAVAGITLGVLGATGMLHLPIGPVIGLFGLAATGLGLVVGDALRQETTTNHPMPQNRASGYALATFLGAYGLGFAGMVALGALPVWAVVFAALGVIASVILFAFLGASQTNRHKAWVRRYAEAQRPANRFEEEPETAARFGIYTVVIWVAAFGAFVALGFTAGWWWAPLGLLGGLATMMLVLARMLFGPRNGA